MVARKFDAYMRSLGTITKNSKLHTVSITENQMEILSWCAVLGIMNLSDLNTFINYSKTQNPVCNN